MADSTTRSTGRLKASGCSRAGQGQPFHAILMTQRFEFLAVLFSFRVSTVQRFKYTAPRRPWRTASSIATRSGWTRYLKRYCEDAGRQEWCITIDPGRGLCMWPRWPKALGGHAHRQGRVRLTVSVRHAENSRNNLRTFCGVCCLLLSAD
jgi:hypothetical protein